MHKYRNEMNPDTVILLMTQGELDIIWQFVDFARNTTGQWLDIAPDGSLISDTINDFIRKGPE